MFGVIFFDGGTLVLTLYPKTIFKEGEFDLKNKILFIYYKNLKAFRDMHVLLQLDSTFCTYSEFIIKGWSASKNCR